MRTVAFLRQRGRAATLVIVMALFILIGLLAYGNRNLVFEQRMAWEHLSCSHWQKLPNQLLTGRCPCSMLTFSDTTCAPSTTARTFAERYIVVDKGSRRITLNPTPPPTPDSSLGMGAADCVKVSGGGWGLPLP